MIKNKTIQYGDQNPYKDINNNLKPSLKLISKSEPAVKEVHSYFGMFSGKSVSVYQKTKLYEKSYTNNERFFKLIHSIKNCFFIACLTIHDPQDHYQLVKEKLQRSWTILCKGSIQKTLDIHYPKFKAELAYKISNLASANLALPTQEEVDKKKQQLETNQISLSPLHISEIPNKNGIRKDEQERFLKDAKENQLDGKIIEAWTKVFEEIECISFEELQKGLVVCCESLQQLIGNADYSIGFSLNKSSKWMAEQALYRLNHMPKSSFTPGTGYASAGSTEQSDLDLDCQHFVIFDDAAYSGSQLAIMISNIEKQIANRGNFKKTYHLHLVVPFISSYTIKKLSQSSEFVKPGHLKINIITTERPIKTKDKSLAYYGDVSRQLQLSSAPCLSITEWKHPDRDSFPDELTRTKLNIVNKGMNKDDPIDDDDRISKYSQTKEIEYHFTAQHKPIYKKDL